MAWTVIYRPDSRGGLGGAWTGQGDSRPQGDRTAHQERGVGHKEVHRFPINSPAIRIRTQDIRIVYHVDGKKIEVLIIAVGARRDSEFYATATMRRR